MGRVLPSVVQTSTSQGSGVVYDSKGDIVTNAHVVGIAPTLQVGLASGGKPLAAEVVGVFAPDDLAVIKVASGSGALHAASFGRSASVRVGEIVLAMGNPLGLTGTVTDGIVSAAGQPAGVGVVSVTPGSPAATVGIHPGDNFVDLAGQPTASVAALQSVLAAHKPGDRLLARVSRDGTESTVQVTLGSLTS